ncbi:MAG TPA: hypothetical protein VLG37_02675 [Candidatus Saccharimonadales bacterium]|nr:hypothetical protein [Candidatus Saccharimonadales bacterium]
MYAVILHTHQKLDRVARRHLTLVAGRLVAFPTAREILHFEGQNGPDASKLKDAQNVEQPWHFVNPFDLHDTQLGQQIQRHYNSLVRALKQGDRVRAAFEAAWLAHALVDGLTPAHHYPYEQELENLRGETRHTRNGLVGRAYIRGETVLESMQRSLRLVGPKGLLTTHAMFEAGAYMIIAPLRLSKARPNKRQLREVRDIGVVPYFQKLSKEVGAMGLYKRFYQKGWTLKLNRDIRREVAPRMALMITLAWYAALYDAGLVEGSA